MTDTEPTISDEAVEAAAEALYEIVVRHQPDAISWAELTQIPVLYSFVLL